MWMWECYISTYVCLSCECVCVKVSFVNLYVFVFVHLGYCNRIPYTGWLINNRNLFFTILEARSTRSRCWQVQCLVSACFLVHKWLSSHCVLTWWKGQGIFGVFYKGTNPIHNSSASHPGPNHLSKASSPHNIKLSIMIWEGGYHKHSVYSSVHIYVFMCLSVYIVVYIYVYIFNSTLYSWWGGKEEMETRIFILLVLAAFTKLCICLTG